MQVFPDDPRGKGRNTASSGIEGPWTERPTEWSNDYFKNLLEYRWEIHKGPGNKTQWQPFEKDTGKPGPDIMMLTTDIAFIHDEEYKKLVHEYASDLEGLGKDFAANWYRLTTSVRTSSWVKSNRCQCSSYRTCVVRDASADHAMQMTSVHSGGHPAAEPSSHGV
jgi:hypothetical protein